MADNITIPATGSGTATPVVATDDAGVAGHVQVVKLAISTDGSATAIPAEATNGLDVDVTRVQGVVEVRQTDGTNDETTLFDVDSGAGAQYVQGVSLRKAASGGSVEYGTSSDPLRVDPTGTTTQPVSGTVTANLSAGTNTNEVVGDAAHDAAVAGNPVLIGGVGETAADSAPGNRASADGDAVRMAVSLDGAVYVHPHGPQIWSYHENSSSALTDTTVHAAPGAGLSLYVTDIVCSTGAATALNIFFEEGASTVLGPYYLEAVAGRGVAISFKTPKKITANTALTVTTSAAIAHSIDITGFTAP